MPQQGRCFSLIAFRQFGAYAPTYIDVDLKGGKDRQSNFERFDILNNVMFSSKSDLWETPKDLFDELDKYFCFTCDVCALPENAKCENYFTPDLDGLKQDWSGVCWCNPPYGKNLYSWVEKAFRSHAIVVMLLPARTDTKWFHDFCLPFGEIIFIRGRLKFGNSKNSAPFPSMIVIFDN